MSQPILLYLYIREVYIILLFVPLSSIAESFFDDELLSAAEKFPILS